MHLTLTTTLFEILLTSETLLILFFLPIFHLFFSLFLGTPLCILLEFLLSTLYTGFPGEQNDSHNFNSY